MNQNIHVYIQNSMMILKNLVDPEKELKKKKKMKVYNTASELYIELLGIYFNEYYDLLNSKKKMDTKMILLI